MSGYLEHSERARHRPEPRRVTSHWSATDPGRWHDGPVSESCPLCHPKETTDEA